jgi:N-acetyl-beta-hexosaminidase
MNRIIPNPNGVLEEMSGHFLLCNLKNVHKGGFSDAAIRAFVERLGIKLLETPEEKADLQLIVDKSLSPEEYQLTVTDGGIKVKAAEDRGVIWALTSLYELLENDGFPCITVEDKPKYQHRGFLLDCARHFFSIEVVKQVIEENALVKINEFHWHLTNDQGWRMESQSFPKLHELNNQDYYTREQMREVVDFAHARGVEVIPEINMPGHTLAAIAAYPELSCSGATVTVATKGGIYENILCAGKDTTYEFAKAILDEVCEIFESEYIHIGGDEAPKREWSNCPHCQAKLAELGSDDYEDLQGYFMESLISHLAKKNKKAIVWNDVLKAPQARNEAIVQYWMEMAADNYTREFIADGGRVIFSDMFALYLDYTECFSSLQRVYEYTPIIKGENFAEDERCLGIQACLWSERVADKETLYKRIYPRLFAMAEAAWTQKRDYNDFERRLMPRLNELVKRGIKAQSLEESNPNISKRIAGVKQFMQALTMAGQDGSAPVFTPEMIRQFMIGFGLEAML